MSGLDGLIENLPQQWVGLVALLLVSFYIIGQAIEKYEKLASILPLSRWWHDRQKKLRAEEFQEVAAAVEMARHEWLSEENQALVSMERRIASIDQTSRQQAMDISGLQETVRAFTAWSQYDSRWHHKTVVENSEKMACSLPQHYDFFEFEKLWRDDPYAAAQLI